LVNPDSKNELRPGSQLRQKVRGLVRDELLQAAEAVFAEKGLQAAKVEDIAARAGVSVGSVYNYFADRQALVEAVMAQRREGLFLELQRLEVETAGQPFLSRLEISLDRVLEYFASQRPFYLMMLEAEGLPRIFQNMVKSSLGAGSYPPGCGGPFAPLYELLSRLMVEGIRERVVREEDPGVLAAYLMGICKGLGFGAVLDPKVPDVRTRKPMILDFFLHGASPP
jgi:AcrR family transcriptional regulator